MGVGDSRRRSRPAWRRRVAAASLMVVALLVAACTGGNDDAENAEPDAPTSDSSEPSDTPSTTAPAETTTSTPPGPPVPEDAPEIINTGDDFEAMYRSLNDFVNWLGMHPDPDLVELAYQPGSKPFEGTHEVIEYRATEGLSADGPQQVIRDVVVNGVGESGLANLVVTFEYPAVSLVDSSGVVVQSREAGDTPSARHLVSLARTDDRWRIETTDQLDG